MKIIFVTLGSQGDFLPFLNLAIEAKSRGFETLILSAEAYRSSCVDAGVAFEAIQSIEELDQLTRNPNLWKPVVGMVEFFKACLKPTAKILGIIQREALGSECLIVSNQFVPGGYLAARKIGLPIATVFLHPYSIPSASDLAKEAPSQNIFLNLIGTPGRKLVLKAFERMMESHMSSPGYFANQRFQTDLVLGLWPDWFCPPKSDWPVPITKTGFVGASLPKKQFIPLDEDFVASSPLVFTMGSEMIQDLAHQTQLFGQVCRTLDRKGIFVTPAVRGKGLVKIDENFLLVESAPFAELFSKACVIISHGGIGTLAQAFAARKAIVTLPMAHDQFDNGYHVERLRLGFSTSYHSVNAARLTKLVRKALAISDLQKRYATLEATTPVGVGARVAVDALVKNLVEPKRKSV